MSSRSDRASRLHVRFLAAVAAGMTVGDACRKAGISRSAAYARRRTDPAFAAAWTDALEDAVERLEAEADRRAVDGTLRPVFHKGRRCGSIRQYSDGLLMFRLKALAPQKYRERVEQSGGVLTVKVVRFGEEDT